MSIEAFDKVLQEYSDAFVAAKNDKEREKVDAKFSKIIDRAEEDLEAAFEKQFQAEREALEKEQKAAEPVDEIEEVKDEFDSKAGEPMRSDVAKLTQVQFKRKYKFKDIRVLAVALDLPTRNAGANIKEAALVASIYKALDQ